MTNNDPINVALGKGWLWPFLVAFLVLLGNGIYSYLTLRVFLQASDSLIHAQNVKSIIRDTYVAVQGAETGQRGYVITGDENYLTDYYQSIQNLYTLIPLMSSVTTELPGQKERFQKFVTLANQKIEEMKRSIELVKTGRTGNAEALIDSDLGLHYMNEIKKIVNEMTAAEDDLLTKRREDVSEGRQQSLILSLVSLGVSVVLLLSVYLFVGRNAKANQAVADLLRLANEDLEEKVKERTATITRYSRELERSNRELQDFAFVASHDLQEPLRKIRAFGDRLQTKYSQILDEQGADYIARMRSAAERMSNLISDLLTYSRVVTKQQTLEIIPLNDIVTQVMDDLEVKIEETKAQIHIDPLPEIECAPWQMKQLFQNLLGNALKFTRKGIPPVIQIHSRPLPEKAALEGVSWHEITVRDNGIGFDEQYVDRIFSPFQRLHQRGEYEGTGIGLAVCRRIIERHDGRITATSHPGEGSTFLIELPSRQPQPHSDIEEKTHELPH